MKYVFEDNNEIILAYEMNGEEIPMMHGYPVRLLVPGFIGVRSVKWVEKLIISDIEAQSIVQQRDYKYVKEKDWANVNFDNYDPIMGNTINSMIKEPKNNS